MTDAVVLDLAAGRVYHFKHGWIPLDHIGRERLRAHGVNPDGYNVVHNGKLAANWKTKRQAIAHADRLNAGKKAAAKVQPSQHASGHHNVVKNGKLVATYQTKAGADRHADQLNAGTKAAASVHHATPTGTGARIDNPRSREIRLGNTAQGGTIKVRATPSTEGEYLAQLRRMAPTNPAAAAALARREGPTKAAPPRRSLDRVKVGTAAPPGELKARSAAAVRMKAPELRALAASGDKVAQAELARRAKRKAK